MGLQPAVTELGELPILRQPVQPEARLRFLLREQRHAAPEQDRGNLHNQMVDQAAVQQRGEQRVPANHPDVLAAREQRDKIDNAAACLLEAADV